MGSVRAFFELFIYFQGCQPLLFKDLTLALQSNTRTEGGKIKKNKTHTHALFGKLIRLCKLFRFLKPSLLKVQYFTHSLFFFFSLFFLFFFFSFSTLPDVFSGENAEANFWRQPDWSFALERTALRSALMMGDAGNLCPFGSGLITALTLSVLQMRESDMKFGE